MAENSEEGSGQMDMDILTEMSGEGPSGLGGSGVELGSGSGENASAEEEEAQEFVEVAEDYYYMAHVMRLLAILHSMVSLAMLVAYYHLKVPGNSFLNNDEDNHHNFNYVMYQCVF